MNKIIFNYKIHVESVDDARTFSGLVDLGFRHFWHSTFQLAGLELPDPRKLKGRERQQAETTLAFTENVLRLLLTDDSGRGRTVVLAPRPPNKYGRTYVSVYVPVRGESVTHPHLTIRRATYLLLNVVHFLQEALEQRLTLEQVRDLLLGFEPYDFDK